MMTKNFIRAKRMRKVKQRLKIMMSLIRRVGITSKTLMDAGRKGRLKQGADEDGDSQANTTEGGKQE